MSNEADLRQRRGDVWFPVAVAAVIAAFAFVLISENFLLLHTFIELMAAVVVLVVATISWHTRAVTDNDYLTVIGLAGLPIGVVTILHALSYKGMQVFPGYDGNLSIQLWVIARLLQALAFVVAPVFLARRLRSHGLVLLGFVVPTALAVSMAFLGRFPDAFIEGQGLTPFKVYSEFAVILLTVVGAWGLYTWRTRFPRNVRLLLWASMGFMIVSEVAFTQYADLFALSNRIGHASYLAAFFLLYVVLVKAALESPFVTLFHKIKEHELELAEANEQLAWTNSHLEETSAELESFFELSPDLLCITGADGTFRRLSPSWEQMMGYGPDDLTGQTFYDLVHPTDVSRTRVALQMQSSGQYLNDFVNRFRHADGTHRWLSWHACINGDVMYAVAHDVTNQRAYEERIVALNGELTEANRVLQEALDSRSRFLASTSHELRTPLNSIIGFSAILADGMSGPLTKEQREQLEIVNSSGKHLLSLINDLLDISKIEAGRVDVSIQPFDPCKLLREVADTLAPLAADKGLALKVETNEQAKVVESDRGKVAQIMLNLAGNAVKFTDEGSVAIRCGCRNGDIRFSVTDTGRGIPEHELSHVFEAFVQLENPGEVKPSGTGLGLVISREYARLLGGEILVESEVGKGSTFTLSIPSSGHVCQ